MTNNILNISVIQFVDYYIQNLSNDFLLNIEHTYHISPGSSRLSTNHYLFGDLDYKEYNGKENYYLNNQITDIENLLTRFPFFERSNFGSLGISQSEHYLKLILLSNDIIYAVHFSMSNDIPQIIFDLSSAIFGKGTFYDYLKFSYKNSQWYLYSGFDRGKVYNRYKGNFIDCLNHMFNKEKEMEHPYQWMIDRHPGIYRQAISNKRKTI